jgi:putative drug exporter of the RND superfamily
VRTATGGARAARIFATTVVGLRHVIVLGWIVALVAAVQLLPGLGGSSSAPLDDIVPADAAAVSAQERALALFGTTLATDTAVVQRDARGLGTSDAAKLVRTAAAATDQRLRPPIRGLRAAVPLINVRVPGVQWRERSTTAVTYLFLAPDLNLEERNRAAHRYEAALGPQPAGAQHGVSGAGPARLQQFEEIDDVLPLIEVATVLVIFVVVALYFRSLAAPLVTLATAGLAYVLAVRGLAWASERAGVTAPSEIAPVLVVLLLGLVTDYTIFFMDDTRRRLADGVPRVVAAREATARIAPIVLAAGVLVAGGAVSLMAGTMQFFRVFGPGLAVCALVVTLVCVTLVPALLALLGPRLFGRSLRAAREDDEAPEISARVPGVRPDGAWRNRLSGMLGALRASRRQAAEDGGSALSRFGVRLLVTRTASVLLALVTIAVLLVAATGARTIDLSVSFIPSLPKDAEARQAADAAARGFTPGVLAPTEVVLEQPGIGERRVELAKLQRAIAEQRGVAAVLGPAQPPRSPLLRYAIAESGDAVRFGVMLGHEPTGSQAIEDFRALRDRLPGMARDAGLPSGAQASYAGETALASETVDSMAGDLRRVAAATAVITLLLLAIFLRALVAPVLLLFGSVLAFAGSFGLAALLLPHVVGGTDVVYYVPLVAAVLLVGLGSDYNVFITGRIREESARRRSREAIATAAPEASRAITVAGITLAATFALLALVPLLPFRELALVMVVGILVDALLVRPLLIPALIAIAGRWAWWPGRARRRPAAADFLDAVGAGRGVGTAHARVATRATLMTLGERIPEREVRELAYHLPEEMAVQLESGNGSCEPFDRDEFVRRVAERSGTSPEQAADDARAVFATLAEIDPEEELDYLRAALSNDYHSLLGDEEAPDLPGARQAERG